MRKFLIAGLIAATLAPVAATAQTHELRRDRQDIREEQRDLRRAYRHGDRRDVREARQDLRGAQREYRQDWQDYRRDHRDVYRRPNYVGPAGYRYRALAPGHRLAPAYYGSRYVISDPWRYRLPPAQSAYRWVRYGNDVVLVDGRSGRVREVHRDFFW